MFYFLCGQYLQMLLELYYFLQYTEARELLTGIHWGKSVERVIQKKSAWFAPRHILMFILDPENQVPLSFEVMSHKTRNWMLKLRHSIENPEEPQENKQANAPIEISSQESQPSSALASIAPPEISSDPEVAESTLCFHSIWNCFKRH